MARDAVITTPPPTLIPYATRLDWAIERAAIMEHDGGLPRAEAEASAAKAHGVNLDDVRGDLKVQPR